jgi:hypothetical protein
VIRLALAKHGTPGWSAKGLFKPVLLLILNNAARAAFSSADLIKHIPLSVVLNGALAFWRNIGERLAFARDKR